jgi:hypothetical protein
MQDAASHPALPERYRDGSVYSNFDHKLDEEAVAELRADPGLHAQHAGWQFCAYVWHDGTSWVEQVWRYHSAIETRRGDELLALIESVNDDYGWD